MINQQFSILNKTNNQQRISNKIFDKLPSNIIIKMGSSSSHKDPHIQLYITLLQRKIYAGRTLQGTVHMESKIDRPYCQLYIQIKGNQKVVNKDQDILSVFSPLLETYCEQFLLARFHAGIQAGQYDFPFSLLLPSTFPASFNYEESFIAYWISAYLLPINFQKNQKQEYIRQLHIRQPHRLLQKTIRAQEKVGAKFCGCCCICCCCKNCRRCCGCCFNCGELSLYLYSGTNNILRQKPFQVEGIIDNTQGSLHISRFKIILKEKIKLCYEQFNKVKNSQIINQYILYQQAKTVKIGQLYSFNLKLTIPANLLGYTAIGNNLSRTYFLELIAEGRCCFYLQPKVSRHVILNNQVQPNLQPNLLPPTWRPIIAQEISFLNLKPYIYQPVKYIKVRNQSGAAIIQHPIQISLQRIQQT